MHLEVVTGLLDLFVLLPDCVTDFEFAEVLGFEAHEVLEGVTHLEELVLFHMSNGPFQYGFSFFIVHNA